MYLPSETLLAIAIVGFYFYDSVALIKYDQYILTHSIKGGYVSFPSRRFQLSGKFLYLYNLLTPFDLGIYFNWPSTEQRLNKKELKVYKDFIHRLLPLRVLATILLVMMVASVFSLLFLNGTNLFIFLFISVYSICLAIAIFILVNKNVLNLSNKECVSLVVDAIACPPFAINVARKIFMRQEITKTPLKFVNQILKKEKFEDFREKLLMKIDEVEVEHDLTKDQMESIKKFKSEVTKIGRI